MGWGGSWVWVVVVVGVWVRVSLIQSGRRACAADFAHIRSAYSNADNALRWDVKCKA